MKILTVLIFFILTFPLIGEEVFSIGFTWIGSSPMSEEVTQGTLELLSDLVPDLRVEIRGNLNDEKELSQLLERYAREKNGVVVLRSSGAKYLRENPQPIPSFIGATNNPLLLGVTTNNERPGDNITGVSYYIEALDYLQFMRQLVPDISSILMAYEIGHPGSSVDRDQFKKACDSLSIEYSEQGFANKSDILNLNSSSFDKVDAVVFGNQALFHELESSSFDFLFDIPTFSLSSLLIPKGVLASLSADDQKLGRLLAGSIISVIFENKKIGDIPIQFDKDPLISININTAEKLGLIIPIHMLRVAEVYR